MSVTAQPIVEARHIVMSYGGDTVLRKTSFTINSGEFIGIIGHNGSGKTTLLRIILGLLKPTEGQVIWPEKKVVGYVPQRSMVSDTIVPISVQDVVRLGSAGHKYVAEQALARVDMGRFAHHRFSQLSGGQQQRVLIAKALATNPNILFLDEPTAGVDEPSQSAFYQLLRKLHNNGLTIVMVSHDLPIVTSLVDRVLHIDHRVVYDGPPDGFNPNDYLLHDHMMHHHTHHHGGHHA